MTLPECTGLLAPLAVTLRADLDGPTFRAYHRALEDVPTRLLAAAVERAAKSDRFMPKPGELRAYAEDARKVLLAAHPFECLCGNCSVQGFVERELDGVRRMVRGSCWRAHQDKLSAIGVGAAPLALPAARDWTEGGDAA